MRTFLFEAKFDEDSDEEGEITLCVVQAETIQEAAECLALEVDHVSGENDCFAIVKTTKRTSELLGGYAFSAGDFDSFTLTETLLFKKEVPAKNTITTPDHLG